MAKAHSTVLDVSGELLEPLALQVLRSANGCLDLADGSEVYQAAVMSARLCFVDLIRSYYHSSMGNSELSSISSILPNS